MGVVKRVSSTREAEPESLSTPPLRLKYIPLSQARIWDENPKLHDLPSLMESIRRYGFSDPPKYDAALDALVYGNGRTAALQTLKDSGSPPPRGVMLDAETGDWAVPVLFGVDAESRDAAVGFAIDHNNLTLGGSRLDFEDLLQLWDEEKLQDVLGVIDEEMEQLVSFDESELRALLSGPDFSPLSDEEPVRLDRTGERSTEAEEDDGSGDESNEEGDEDDHEQEACPGCGSIDLLVTCAECGIEL